jgi:glycosyltransferase involved in cell wall biosynthesis
VRVITLVESLDHVCARYRANSFVKDLASFGIDMKIVALPRAFPARQQTLWNLKGERVILLRKLLPWIDWKILRSRASWIAFDLDDAVFLRDSYSGKGFTDSRRQARFQQISRDADAIAAGNTFLANAAREHGARGSIKVIPTCVDPDAYIPRHASDIAGILDLVWIGSASTLQGLDRFRETLEAIGKRAPGVRLIQICDRFLEFKHLETIHAPWSSATEARDLASAHVGISWIPDDPWSRGKCGLKLLQSMAAGLPVVANPVGVHPEMVTPNGNGILASDTDEWVDAIIRLRDDTALRTRLGQAGRALVEERYSIGVGARQWMELLS